MRHIIHDPQRFQHSAAVLCQDEEISLETAAVTRIWGCSSGEMIALHNVHCTDIHALTIYVYATATTINQIKTSTAVIGVTDEAINATCIRFDSVPLRKLHWLLSVFFPSTSADTPLARVVMITLYNLHRWCFPSNHWHKYSTCTRAARTVWWSL